jgi:hypothetical protein
MTRETEESLRMMAQVVLNTVNRHIKAESDGVTADYIFHYFQTAYDEGVRDGAKMIEIQPWEMTKVSLYRDTGRGTQESAMDVVDGRLSEGWEPWQVCGPDGRYLLMRRRRAVAEIAAKENRE